MRSANITWTVGAVSRIDRYCLLGQQGLVIWFTGLSGSGKSTIARALETRLFHLHKLCYVLDGDNIRHGLSNNLGFSNEDRMENLRRVAETANLMLDAGIITIVSTISPLTSHRDMVENILGDSLISVFVDTPIEECERRDPKGLYKMARDGIINDFTGISAPYERPEKANITIETVNSDTQNCVDRIMSYLHDFSLIRDI
jgi:adenylylsulfate kinase